MLDAVGIELGVGDLKIDDRVDLHGDVILGDDGLGIEVGDLLLEADLLDHALNEGDLQVQADVPRRAVRAETLDDVGAGLLHDVDVAHNKNEHEHDEHDDADVVEDGCDRHSYCSSLSFLTKSLTPSMRTMVTMEPRAITSPSSLRAVHVLPSM